MNKKTSDDEIMVKSFQESWIVYHLSAALAMREMRRNPPGKRSYAINIFNTVQSNIRFFVIAACKTCSQHHEEYLKKNPIIFDNKNETSLGCFEYKSGNKTKYIVNLQEWVFKLHNAVNLEIGKSILDKDMHLEKVIKHYDDSLIKYGKGMTASVLCNSLTFLIDKYCYKC